MNLKHWEKKGKRGLTRVLGKALRARGEAGPMPDLADLRSILLVRQQNQLGDMLLGTPVFRAVRARAPEARIDLVTGDANHEPVRLCAHLDEVLRYDKAAYLRNPAAGKRFADRLRDARYDLVLVLSTVSFSTTSAWIAAVAGAAKRAGRPAPDGRGAEVCADLYHWVQPAPVPLRHQTGVNLDQVTPFGADGDDWTPEMFLDGEQEREGAAALDETLGAPGEGLRVVIHPGAGKRPNRWPAERFGEVAAALMRDGHRVAVATGPSETDLFAGVDAGAGRALPRLPGMPLHSLGGALRAADLLLANDTGVLHVGASVDAPVLALFGPTDPAQWCPSAPRVWFLRAADGDLRSLPTANVADAARSIARRLAGDDVPAAAIAAPVPETVP